MNDDLIFEEPPLSWAETDSVLTEVMSLAKLRAKGRMDDDEPLFRRFRSRLLLSPYLAAEGREFLARHRTLQQIWDRTLSRVPSYRERRQLVDDAFDSTLRRMEDRDIGVIAIDPDVLTELDMDEANRIWTRARARLEQQPPDAEGAVTLARALLESVAKRILDHYGGAYSATDTPANLCRRALGHVVPPEMLGLEHFRRFTQSSANIIEHVGLYRGDAGDAHGSPLAREVARHEASYAVNLAGSTAVFLVECFRSSQA